PRDRFAARDPDGDGDGDTQLHGAGAGGGREQARLPAGGRLLAGSYPLRPPDGQASFRGPDSDGDAVAGHDGRAAAPIAAAAAAASRSGHNLPEMPAQGTGEAVRHGRGTGRRLAAFSGRGVDSGGASGAVGATGEVGTAAAGGGGTLGGQ